MKPGILLIVTLAAPLFAQYDRPVRYFMTNPTGACRAVTPLWNNWVLGRIYACVGASNVSANDGTWTLISGGGGTPGGSNGEIQYNNSGSFGGLGTTGTGNVVRATSPTLITPNLGTPSAATLTNAAGLPLTTGIAGFGTGVATALGQNVSGTGGICLSSGSACIATGASITSVGFSATPTFDGGNGTVKTFTMTLTGNVSSCTLQNFTPGQVVTFQLMQDGTGARTFACAGITNLGTVSGVASKLDTQTFIAPTASTLTAVAPMWCVTCDAAVILPEVSSAPSGISSTAVIYTKTDHLAYVKLNSGSETQICTAASGCTRTIASGTATLGTSAIGANACATAVTVSATGVATTDVISFTPNADLNAVTGYGKGSSDGLVVYPYPTADNVNFKVCNVTGSSITPGAATLNFRVVR